MDELPVEGDERPTGGQQTVEGVVELLPNGSGFVRVDPPEPSEDDVYVSAAQVKRCELISGDRISGPRRAPRRSERFASLARIDTINGRPAAEVVDATRFEDLPAGFPTERFQLDSEDETIGAIQSMTPFGRGSRVTIVGPPQAGKTEALRRLVTALADREEVQLSVVLSGIRPEEIPEWTNSQIEPMAVLSLAASPDARAQAVEGVVDRGRRLAARGSDAVVAIDTLDGLHPAVARKALAAARNIVDGGSLTVIATAAAPLGGETTVIALDPVLAGTRRFPAVALGASWTMRAELLVGEEGADAIAQARAQADG
jgi:transcription termination factor Rho